MNVGMRHRESLSSLIGFPTLPFSAGFCRYPRANRFEVVCSEGTSLFPPLQVVRATTGSAAATPAALGIILGGGGGVKIHVTDPRVRVDVEEVGFFSLGKRRGSDARLKRVASAPPAHADIET